MSEQPLPVERFDYELPPELIAQTPIEPRDASRLLVVERASGALHDDGFRSLPNWLQPGDLLVLNDTRVIPARLHARRATGGFTELLLLQRRPDGSWSALARPAKRLRLGERLLLLDRAGDASGDAVAIVGREADEVVVRFDDDAAIHRHGQAPLPPYIHERLDDAERYQTVYARVEGSAAAPTAGMHFTDAVFAALRERGVGTAQVTLHVGLDTFQPIKTDDARDHQMHSEWYEVPPATAAAIRATRERGSRIVAIGTTSVRTLESAADGILAGRDDELRGATRLYITPGYRFQLVDVMQTNFHLPRTTLMLLVSAFAGEELIRHAYAHAVAERYRFLSFGDAMLIV